MNSKNLKLMTIEEIFHSHIKIETYDCWTWTGSILNGYGRLTYKGQTKKAHRVSWELYYGIFNTKLYVCHKCDNTECVNPNHLFLGSPKDNMKDMVAKNRAKNQHKNKTHCKNGHPLNSENVYASPNGQRVCKPCRRIVDDRRANRRIGGTRIPLKVDL